jgi:hypothetical protein
MTGIAGGIAAERPPSSDIEGGLAASRSRTSRVRVERHSAGVARLQPGERPSSVEQQASQTRRWR